MFQKKRTCIVRFNSNMSTEISESIKSCITKNTYGAGMRCTDNAFISRTKCSFSFDNSGKRNSGFKLSTQNSMVRSLKLKENDEAESKHCCSH